MWQKTRIHSTKNGFFPRESHLKKETNYICFINYISFVFFIFRQGFLMNSRISWNNLELSFESKAIVKIDFNWFIFISDLCWKIKVSVIGFSIHFLDSYRAYLFLEIQFLIGIEADNFFELMVERNLCLILFKLVNWGYIFLRSTFPINNKLIIKVRLSWKLK